MTLSDLLPVLWAAGACAIVPAVLSAMAEWFAVSARADRAQRGAAEGRAGWPFQRWGIAGASFERRPSGPA
ncbi:MAG: hypothetical protein ACYDEN_00810 [Acidimicrobiales bacterium]